MRPANELTEVFLTEILKDGKFGAARQFRAEAEFPTIILSVHCILGVVPTIPCGGLAGRGALLASPICALAGPYRAPAMRGRQSCIRAARVE